MQLLLDNLVWMSWNVFLAVLGWLFAIYFSRAIKSFHKAVWALLWLLFLPNTVYLFTDLKHLFEQWSRVGEALQPVLLVQYAVLIGIACYTYLKSMRVFEAGLLEWMRSSVFWQSRKDVALLRFSMMRHPERVFVLLNFLIAFGVVMGRVMRTNSWHVFTQPLRVINDGVAVLTSWELLLFTLIFGVIVNSVWLAGKTLKN